MGRRGEAFLAGLLAGQPGDLDPCLKVGVILTNARTGEVLDRQSYDVDAAPTR